MPVPEWPRTSEIAAMSIPCPSSEREATAPPPPPRTNPSCAAGGETSQDRERAARICDGLPADAEILKVDLMQTVADLHVSRGLYTAMRLDTLSARKFGYRLIDDMPRGAGAM